MRGARFNFGGRFKLAPSIDDFRRGLDRVRELGWFVKVFGFEDDFLPVADELRKIDFPAIIDHMGGPDYRRGTAQPAIRLILDLLKNGNWWIGLSNGDLRSHTGSPWDDAVEFGRMFYEAAPDRCLWGTDWPHVHRFIRPDKDGHSDYGLDHEMAARRAARALSPRPRGARPGAGRQSGTVFRVCLAAFADCGCRLVLAALLRQMIARLRTIKRMSRSRKSRQESRREAGGPRCGGA